MGLPPTQQQSPVSLQTPSPLHVARWARNGMIPSSLLESEMGSALNFVGACRTRELFRYHGAITAIPSSSGTPRDRFRFASHSSPLHRRVRAIILMARQNAADPLAATGTLTITDASGTPYGSDSFTFGNSQSASSDVPSEFGWGELIVSGVPADTAIYGLLSESETGRIISATVFEESVKLVNAAYVQPSNVAVSSPIYDARREKLYELATSLWKRGAAQLFNFSVHNQASPITNASGTYQNVLDAAVTTVSASTPGWTIDLENCRRRATTTVPCLFKCFAKMSGASDQGEVSLLDSTGTPVVTLSINGSTAAWYSSAVSLPATDTKWDVHFANPDFGTGAGETISVYACSLYQFAS